MRKPPGALQQRRGSRPTHHRFPLWRTCRETSKAWARRRWRDDRRKLPGIGPNGPETATEARNDSRNEQSVASDGRAITPTDRSHRTLDSAGECGPCCRYGEQSHQSPRAIEVDARLAGHGRQELRMLADQMVGSGSAPPVRTWSVTMRQKAIPPFGSQHLEQDIQDRHQGRAARQMVLGQ